MDGFITVPVGLREAFERLIEPRHLSSWLPAVERVQPLPGAVAVPFAVELRGVGQQLQPGTGELLACEPPRQAVFRFLAGETVSVVRVTCTRTGRMTRVHVQQQEPALRPALQVDLNMLARLLTAGSSELVRPGDRVPAQVSDVDAIAATVRRLQRALATCETDGLEDLYCVDADGINALGAVGKGGTAIAAHLREQFAAGDCATDRPADPPRVTIRRLGNDVVVVVTRAPGHCSLHVLRRDPAGSWLIVSEMHQHAWRGDDHEAPLARSDRDLLGNSGPA